MFSRRAKSKAEPAAAATTSETEAPVPEATAASNTEELRLGEHAGGSLAQVDTTATEDIEYPSGLKLGLLLASIFISMFLVALVGLPLLSEYTMRCSPTRHHPT